MSDFLDILTEIEQDLDSGKAKVYQALGNAKYMMGKVFGRKKQRKDKRASKWDALHEYYRLQNDEYRVNIMNVFKNFSRASEDPDPAHYFHQIHALVRDSNAIQRKNVAEAFWHYYDVRYNTAIAQQNRLEEADSPYRKSEEELVRAFLLVAAKAQENLVLLGKDVLRIEKTAAEEEFIHNLSADFVSDLNQNPILHQKVLDFIKKEQEAEQTGLMSQPQEEMVKPRSSVLQSP